MAESTQSKTPPMSVTSTTANSENKEEILIVAESLLEQYRVQILVGTVLVVAIIVAYFSYTQNLKDRTDKAWENFSQIIENDNLEAVTNDLEKMLEIDALGTEAEPWVMWQLAHTYVTLNKFHEAKEKLLALRSRYPKHYLNQKREVTALEDSTPIAKSLAAIEVEIGFWKDWKNPEKKNNPQAELFTSKGTLRFELYESHSPNVVKMFVHLAETGFYDNMKFRDAFNNRVHCGSLMSDGKGNAGYVLQKEFSDEPHDDAGALAMETLMERDEIDGKFYFTTAKMSTTDSKLEDQQNVVFGRLLQEDQTKLNYFVSPTRLEKLKQQAEFKKLAEAPTEEAKKEAGRKQQEQIMEALASFGFKVYWTQSEFESELNKKFTENEISIPKELFQGIVTSLSDPILGSFNNGDILFKVTIFNKRPETVYVPKEAQGIQK